MLKTQSVASKRREQQRTSPETLKFKLKLCSLLEHATPEVSYGIKRDLSIMTNMPFYKDRPPKIKISLTPLQLLNEYVKFFIECEDKKFIALLIKKLSCNQSQVIRKVAPRIGPKKEVWEHVIPVKFITEELIKMIHNREIRELNKLLEIYSKAGQRGITKEQDSLLKLFRTTMPNGWDWRDPDVDPLTRHKQVGIVHL